MVKVYKKYNYDLYSNGKEFIIYNTKKEFKYGHTHVKSFKTGKFLIDLSIHETIPKHLPQYYIESLIRITESDDYKKRLIIILKK